MLLNNCSGEHGVFLALCTRCKPAGVCLPSVPSCTRPLVSEPKQTGYCNMLRSRTVCYRKYRIQQRAVCIWHVRRRVSPQRTEKIAVHCCYTIYIYLIIAVLQEIKHQNRTTHKISVGKHRCATIKNQTEQASFKRSALSVCVSTIEQNKINYRNPGRFALGCLVFMSICL